MTTTALRCLYSFDDHDEDPALRALKGAAISEHRRMTRAKEELETTPLAKVETLARELGHHQYHLATLNAEIVSRGGEAVEE